MLLALVVVALFTTTIVNQVHPDVTRPSMNHPNQIVFVQIATSHWLRLDAQQIHGFRRGCLNSNENRNGCDR